MDSQHQLRLDKGREEKRSFIKKRAIQHNFVLVVDLCGGDSSWVRLSDSKSVKTFGPPRLASACLAHVTSSLELH